MKTYRYRIFGGIFIFLLAVLVLQKAIHALSSQPQQNVPPYNIGSHSNVYTTNKSQPNSLNFVSAQSVTNHLQNSTIIYAQPEIVQDSIESPGVLVNIKDILKKVIVSPDPSGGSDIEVDVNFQQALQPVNNTYSGYPEPSGGYLTFTGDHWNYIYKTPSLYNFEIDAVYIALFKDHIVDPGQIGSVTVTSYITKQNDYGNQASTQMATTTLSKNDLTQFNWKLDNESIAELLNNLWVQRFPENSYMCNQSFC